MAVVGLVRRSLGRMIPATAQRYKRFVCRYEAFRSASPASRPTSDTVQAFIHSLPVSQQSPAKTALQHELGKKALDWDAITVGRYRRNEAALHAGILDAAARERLREAITDHRDLALLEALWVLRRAEVAALDWPDLTLETGVVYVRHGKGGKPAWTILPQRARLALLAWHEAAGKPTAGPVFPAIHYQGKFRQVGRYSPAGIQKIVQARLTKAGLWRPGLGAAHRFRRSFATAYLKEHPGDLKGLQVLMRHEQVSTTARYAWLSADDLAPRLARVSL